MGAFPSEWVAHLSAPGEGDGLGAVAHAEVRAPEVALEPLLAGNERGEAARDAVLQHQPQDEEPVRDPDPLQPHVARHQPAGGGRGRRRGRQTSGGARPAA